MEVQTARASRRAAIVAALAGAALAAAPAVALGASSTVTYSNGTVTVAGDADDHAYDVDYDTSSGLVVTITDASGTVAIANASQSPPCSDAGPNVVCTQNPSQALNSVVVTGGPGNDTVSTSGDVDGQPLTFHGGAGDDLLQDGLERDTFDGGDGYDQANYLTIGRTDPVTVSADGVAGDGKPGENDNIEPSVEEIDGTDLDDTLTATSSPSTDVGGDVELFGHDGDDTLNAGTGGNLLEGDAGNDTINGGPGDDFLEGDDGNDTLHGGAGDDSFEGDNGNDVMDGGAGDDSLQADAGADDIHGGAGFDGVEYGAEPYAGSILPTVSVSLDDVANDGMADQDGAGAAGPGVAAAGPAADNVHSDVEAVQGSFGDDTLIGDAAANLLEGFGGNDTIDGRGGADVLTGDAGNDTIAARDNAPDLVLCGEDSDTATTDDIDTAFGCEHNDVARATLPVQTVPVPVPVPAPKDTIPPKVTLGGVKSTLKRKSFLKSGVSFTLAASEAVTYDVTLTGTAKGAHVAKAGDLVLAAKALSSSGSRTTVRLKLSSRLRKAIGKRAKLRLTVVAVDAGGNKTTVTKTIKVK